MKKLLITILVTSSISFMFGNFIFTNYKRNLKESNTINYENVYMVLYGSYKDESKIDFPTNEYVIEKVNGFYKVYVGICDTLDYANRVKTLFKEKYEDVYIEERIINSKTFMEVLGKYSSDFSNKADTDMINDQKEIIYKYKELVLNE